MHRCRSHGNSLASCQQKTQCFPFLTRTSAKKMERMKREANGRSKGRLKRRNYTENAGQKIEKKELTIGNEHESKYRLSCCIMSFYAGPKQVISKWMCNARFVRALASSFYVIWPAEANRCNKNIFFFFLLKLSFSFASTRSFLLLMFLPPLNIQRVAIISLQQHKVYSIHNENENLKSYSIYTQYTIQ